MIDQQSQPIMPSMASHPGFINQSHYPLQQVPPPFNQGPPSIPTSGHPFFPPWEPLPPPASPPPDPDLQKRIDKLVEYAAKNGPQFEALMKEKQKNNPAYAFLSGGEGHEYYRYRLWTAVNSTPMANPPSSSLHPSQNMNSGGGIAGNLPETGFGSSLPYYDHQSGISSVPPSGPPPFLNQYSTPVSASGDPFRYHQAPPNQGLPRPSFSVDSPMGGGGGGGGGGEPSYSFGVNLPPDVAVELSQVLDSLTGTKEVIKNAKAWFMQRIMYAQPFIEILKTRVQMFSGEPDRQLHIIYLVNDILFNSLQHRPVPTELDHVALAFRPALGIILATIFHGPNSSEGNQERLRKILDFWGTKEVYDQDTINQLEGEMMAGPPPSELGMPQGMSATPGLYFPSRWAPSDQQSLPQVQTSGSLPGQFMTQNQFPPSTVPDLFSQVPGQFQPPIQPSQQEPPPEQPPYPLFPPGLIPGMVRKMQIGSGVPYSSISPVDIPTQIPPQTASESYILKRIKVFFRDIGEVDPLEGQVEEPEEEDARETEGVGLGGVRIPPPAIMEVDPETGTLPDGSVASRGGLGSSGRAGLGAHDPDEESQYDDVYSSYRKSRSSNYHTSLSVRAAMKYEHA